MRRKATTEAEGRAALPRGGRRTFGRSVFALAIARGEGRTGHHTRQRTRARLMHAKA